jgi:hypothetical protein
MSKGKIILFQAMKAYGKGGRGTGGCVAPLIINLGTRWGGGRGESRALLLGRSTSGKSSQCLLNGRRVDPTLWNFWSRKEPFASAGNRTVIPCLSSPSLANTPTTLSRLHLFLRIIYCINT